ILAQQRQLTQLQGEQKVLQKQVDIAQKEASRAHHHHHHRRHRSNTRGSMTRSDLDSQKPQVGTPDSSGGTSSRLPDFSLENNEHRILGQKLRSQTEQVQQHIEQLQK